jgi:hypothetical protein
MAQTNGNDFVQAPFDNTNKVEGDKFYYESDQSPLTKREYLSAMALQGLMANPDWTSTTISSIAEVSVKAADALIAELNRYS